jgi:hypothetical protein
LKYSLCPCQQLSGTLTGMLLTPCPNYFLNEYVKFKGILNGKSTMEWIGIKLQEVTYGVNGFSQ